jgi:Cdc6-like AAA superfamily ATPase
VKCAFRHRAITNSQIRLISLAANGDIRVGIEVLSKAGKKAEKRQLKEITFKEIEEVIFEVNRLYNLYPIHELNEHQKTILRILERYKKIQSGRLYKEYVKLVSNPVVDRSYRKYMEKMNEMELIKSEGKGRWRRYTLNI